MAALGPALVVGLAGGLARPAAAADYAKGDMALGSKDAPVTVVEYASMTCPHCANFANDVFPAFRKKYIDTGKVHFIFREFPFDRYALQASMLARCAGEKRYFGLVEAFFAQQQQWVRLDDPLKGLKQIARLGGMSGDQIQACLDDKSLSDMILNTRLEGNKKHGVDATPSFLVNGTKYSGEMSLERWDEILAPLLK